MSNRMTVREMKASLPEDCKFISKVDHNTYKYSHNGSVVVRLYSTNIVEKTANGFIILSNGGHQTVTTKDRINQALKEWSPDNGLGICQRDYTWYLTWHTGKMGAWVWHEREFDNGMVIDPNRPGTILNQTH